MRVLVCGGRAYGDRDRVYAVLDKLHADAGVSYLCEGGARGADQYAREWAYKENISQDTFQADWENHGSFAGPMRNTRMLIEAEPDVVIAFAGGRGTADMVRKARKAGVEVVEISP